MPEEFGLCKRSRLARQLAELIAAIAVIISAGAFDASPLEANPPHKSPPGGGPTPQQIQQKMQEQQRKEQQMLQELLKQQQRWHEQMKKQREEYHKQQLLKKQPGTPPPGTKPGAHPHPEKRNVKPPVIGANQFPARKQACNALVRASRHVHAAFDFPVEPKEVALGSIREALLGLGEVPLPPTPLLQKGNHILWAEEHLQTAHRDVLNARNLPHEVKVPVLGEIHKAMFVLRHRGTRFPEMEKARHELVQALHHVHAADGLPVRRKGEALTNIREAMLTLGQVPPAPVAPSQKADHIRLAEGHLRGAYKDVFEARHLPHELRAPVLRDIHTALFVLTHPETPFPNMKPTLDELVRAWHQVDAASGMSNDRRELAHNSIGEAIVVLGENLPRPRPHPQEGDHIKLAEEHLHRAHQDVVSKKHLPHELKEVVLEEIHRATVVLKHFGKPDGRVSAPK
jgi:hypothetical protein